MEQKESRENSMIALTSLENLYQTKKASEQLKNNYPEAFEKLLHLISLTRQLQFRYQYMGCLLTGEDYSKYSPKHTRKSIINLYLQEVNNIKNVDNDAALKQFFSNNKECGYDNISKLVIGTSPEFLKGI